MHLCQCLMQPAESIIWKLEAPIISSRIEFHVRLETRLSLYHADPCVAYGSGHKATKQQSWFAGHIHHGHLICSKHMKWQAYLVSTAYCSMTPSTASCSGRSPAKKRHHCYDDSVCCVKGKVLDSLMSVWTCTVLLAVLRWAHA